MSEAAMTEKLLTFLNSQLRDIRPVLPAEWPPQAHYKADLNLDSLDLVELVARIEQEYGVLVPEADLPQFISNEATLRYVVEHIKE